MSTTDTDTLSSENVARETGTPTTPPTTPSPTPSYSPTQGDTDQQNHDSELLRIWRAANRGGQNLTDLENKAADVAQTYGTPQGALRYGVDALKYAGARPGLYAPSKMVAPDIDKPVPGNPLLNEPRVKPPESAESNTETAAALAEGPPQTSEEQAPVAPGVARGMGATQPQDPYVAKIEEDYQQGKIDREDEIRAILARGKAFEGAQGAAEAQQRAGAQTDIADENQTRDRALAHLDEVHQLVDDYTNRKIDPNKWWSDKTIPQKIQSVVGGFLAGLGGGVEGARNFINDQINRSLALQEEDIGRQEKGIGQKENLLNSFINISHHRDDAVAKARLALTEAAYNDVARAVARPQSQIEAARAKELMDAMDQVHQQAYSDAWWRLHQPVGTGNAGNAANENVIPLEAGYDTAAVESPQGKPLTVLFPKGGEDTNKRLAASEDAIRGAEELKAAIADFKQNTPPSFNTGGNPFITSPAMIDKMRRIKAMVTNIAQYDAASGGGSRSSLGQMKVYIDKLGDIGNESNGALPGPVDAYRFKRAIEGMGQAADQMEADIRNNRHNLLSAVNPVVGEHTLMKVPKGKGQYETHLGFRVYGHYNDFAGRPAPAKSPPSQADVHAATGFQPNQ
jgi:hypothetical protein